MIRQVFLAAAGAVLLALPARADIDIQEVTTPSGINAWLVEERSIPFVALEILFRGGSVVDPEDQLGVANLMSSLLDEGAGELDARAFERESDMLAVSISSRLNRDALSISARFLTENRDESVALLRSVLTEPRFDEDAIERVRARTLSSLESDAKDPQALARAAFDDHVYAGHPYANPRRGTIETVSALTRDDLIAAHDRAITRDGIYVSAVGDIDAEELSNLLETLFDGLPEATPDLPGPIEPQLSGEIKVIEFETPQTVIRFAQPGVSRDDPDFFAAFILNHILGGGGFESRLVQEVRANRGLTYGIGSSLSIGSYADVWIGSTSTANHRVAETMQVIRDEWTRLHEEGITAEELEAAKTFLTGSFPLRFDGNSRIASIAVNMQFDDMPADYIATRNDQVNAVTLEQVNRVARERLDPDALIFIMVGQPEGIEPTTN